MPKLRIVALLASLCTSSALFAQGSPPAKPAPPSTPAPPAAPPKPKQTPEQAIRENVDAQAKAAQGQPRPEMPQNPALASALVNLQVELNSLNSMSDAAAQLSKGSKRRVAQMTEFVASKNLQQAFTDFQKTWKPNSAPLTFQQAYTTALNAEHLHGQPWPSTNDVDVLTREVMATTTMVQKTWMDLNSLRSQVSQYTQFLTNQKLLKDYQTFAAAKAKAFKAEMDARAAQQATLEQDREAKHKASKQAALEYLQKQWDAQSHLASSGTNYNYSFSQSASQPGQFSQTPSTAFTAGSGAEAPEYPADPYPGVYDYWTGTYWNGYADPYYDVYGPSTFNGPVGSPIGEGMTPEGAYRRNAGGGGRAGRD